MSTLNLNGKDHQLDVTEDMPLLWAIRDVVGYTGTKFGCGMGLCGSCCLLYTSDAADDSWFV